MLTVHVDPGSLSMTTDGLITGVLALQDNSVWFPEERWSDAPVIVLGWWLEELSRLASGQSPIAHCMFMEGPFSFSATLEGAEIAIQCRRRGERAERVILEARAPKEAFMRSLQSTASAIIATCQERRWETPELNELRERLGNPVSAGSA